MSSDTCPLCCEKRTQRSRASPPLLLHFFRYSRFLMQYVYSPHETCGNITFNHGDVAVQMDSYIMTLSRLLLEILMELSPRCTCHAALVVLLCWGTCHFTTTSHCPWHSPGLLSICVYTSTVQSTPIPVIDTGLRSTGQYCV